MLLCTALAGVGQVRAETLPEIVVTATRTEAELLRQAGNTARIPGADIALVGHTHVTEVIGLEGDVITTQDLFSYEYEGENRDGTLKGQYKSSGVRPHFTKRAAYYGLDRPLQQAMMV